MELWNNIMPMLLSMDDEALARFIRYLFAYGEEGTIPSLDGMERTVWIALQIMFDSFYKKEEQEKQKELKLQKNFRKRWEPKIGRLMNMKDVFVVYSSSLD